MPKRIIHVETPCGDDYDEEIDIQSQPVEEPIQVPDWPVRVPERIEEE